MTIKNFREIIKVVKVNGLEIDEKYSNGKFINFFKEHSFFNYFSHHISHKIFHINYKKNYFSFNSTKSKNSQILIRIYNKISYFLSLFKLFLLLLKNFEKKKLQETDLVFFTNHRISNENNIYPITNNLEENKKNYIVLFETYSEKKITDYSKIYNKDKLFNLKNKISFYNFILSLIFTFKNIDKVILIKKNSKKISLFNLIFECLKCRYLYLNYKSTLRQIKPKKILINYSVGKEFFICAAKNLNETIEIYGYALHGVSFSNQSLTSHYLFNHLDKLFVYGKADYKHFFYLKKKNLYFSLPKKLIIAGSVRDFLALNKYKKYKNSKNDDVKKMIFIKSNPNMLNDIDGKYCSILFDCFKGINKNKIILKLKERNIISESTKKLLKENFLKYNDVISDEFLKTEDLIYDSDYIFGTYSTSFIYQSVFFDRVLIQLGSQEIFWANLRKIGFCVANTQKEINEILFQIENDNFDYKKYIFNQSLLKKYLISNNENPSDFIIKELYR